MSISRRSFLKRSAVSSAAASLVPGLTIISPSKVLAAPSPLNKWPGRVVLNYDDRTGVTQGGGTAAAQAKVKIMVDDTIKLFTGKTDVGEAWKSIFPTLTSSTKIVLKTNVIYPGSIPHPFVVASILQGLLQMQVGGTGFPAANLTVFDRFPGGGRMWAHLGYPGPGVIGAGQIFPAGVTVMWVNGEEVTQAYYNYDVDYHKHGDGANGDQAYADVVHNANYIINLPSYKGHQVVFANGVTMAFKSHYGTYSFPVNHHGDGLNATDINTPGSRAAIKYLREINSTGVVYNKQVINILSNLFAHNQFSPPHNGTESFSVWSKTKNPAYTGTASNAIAMTTDPVTCDALGFKILRINKSQTYGITDMPDYLRASAGIDVTGVTPTYNLGEIDESRWTYGEIVNGAITHSISVPPVGLQRNDILVPEERISVYPNPANPQANIDFILPSEYTGQQAEVGIYNMKGGVVRRFGQKVMGVRTTSTWDGRDASGRIAASGRYVAEVKVGGRKLTAIINMVH